MLQKEKLTRQHKRSLARARRLVNLMIKDLETALISRGVIEDEGLNEWKYVWGDKENAISALTKLTTLLVKIIPMEQDLLDYEKLLASDDIVKNNLTEDDKEIIRRYFRRWQGQSEDDQSSGNSS